MTKAIRIFRHIDCEGPAYFQTLLEQQQVPYELVRIDEGEKVKNDLDSVSGLIFMGGNMSVNDPIDWIAEEVSLIQSAVDKNIPVLGICLGSQLMAKAMGAAVYPGSCMELGWAPVKSLNQTAWTKDLPDELTVFHWHGETFDLPENAVAIFGNDRYANQGFVLGPHLALQFHLEMEADIIREWLDRYPEDLEKRCLPEHDKEDILKQTKEHIHNLQVYATSLFHHWLGECKLHST